MVIINWSSIKETIFYHCKELGYCQFFFICHDKAAFNNCQSKLISGDYRIRKGDIQRVACLKSNQRFENLLLTYHTNLFASLKDNFNFARQFVKVLCVEDIL